MVLLAILFQDCKSYSVYAFYFPILGLLLLARNYYWSHLSISEIGERFIFNFLFLLLQGSLVSLYFSIKNKRWVNIFQNQFGAGDALLLVTLAIGFSFINFVLFYVVSLCFVLGMSLLISTFHGETPENRSKSKKIPLAGLQAGLLIVYLLAIQIKPVLENLPQKWFYERMR